ncbi:hypothetical protein [Dactylosporangium cerinum]
MPDVSPGVPDELPSPPRRSTGTYDTRTTAVGVATLTIGGFDPLAKHREAAAGGSPSLSY